MAAAAAPEYPSQEPSAGWQQALAAHRASRITMVVDPGIRAAAERQARDRARETEQLFGDGRAGDACERFMSRT
ncbi:hypothetical protein Sliba_00840 [Streptomyces nigrescens]|uniref:Uncharacterized protein n=1 Tax=Streptomyces nigrescens TaxID=1920 RepID=A0A640TAX1_STRNI|nr:hypothetical protein Sliba_00840 [Streptomyces libani subsp. libani]GGW04469.1 hypothetical protein GCM10010500_66580 [Streptomyces libani subsp. libani]